MNVKITKMSKRVRRFSQGSPIISSYIRDIVNKDKRHIDGDEKKMPYLEKLSCFSLVIPEDGAVKIDKTLEDDPFLTDRKMKTALEESKLINWCPGIKRLIPLSVTIDGNTLCHSTSVALWGIHDRELTLRGLIHKALQSDHQKEFKERWLPLWKSRCNDNTEDAEMEWSIQLKIADETNRSARRSSPIYDPLEDLHIFVLANVLRRPIVVFADRPVRSSNEESEITPGFATAYLPLLWPSNKCVKTPVVLGYFDNYFAPLVTLGGISTDSSIVDICPEVLPMVRENMSPIEVRYLSPIEETYRDNLLKDYLILADVEATKNSCTYLLSAAKMIPKCLEESRNLLLHFLAARSNDICQKELPIPVAPTKVVVRRVSRFKCGNKSCSGYITNESLFPYCADCHGERSLPLPPVRRKNTTGNLNLTIQPVTVECETIGCPYSAWVNSFPYCQRCYNRTKSTDTAEDGEREKSLEECWKKLAMGVIDEKLVAGSNKKIVNNADTLSKFEEPVDKEEIIYRNSQKIQAVKIDQESNKPRQRTSSVTSARSVQAKPSYEKSSERPKASETVKSNRKVSWVNEPCENKQCQYFASIYTYPFCHQCTQSLQNERISVSRKVSGTARTLPMPTLYQE